MHILNLSQCLKVQRRKYVTVHAAGVWTLLTKVCELRDQDARP